MGGRAFPIEDLRTRQEFDRLWDAANALTRNVSGVWDLRPFGERYYLRVQSGSGWKSVARWDKDGNLEVRGVVTQNAALDDPQ